jgi:hypothetical protein
VSSIRIIATPPSELAPLHIREAWLGVEIPLPTKGHLRKHPVSDFKLGSSNDGGHIVLRSDAIQALRNAGQEEAAEFWGRFPLGMYLEFRRDVCEEI